MNFLPSLKIFPPHLIIFHMVNILPKEKKTPKWLVNCLLITWLFWYCSFQSLQLHWELSDLCKKGSPHAKPCGEVEIFGLPIKCWKLRWLFINCNKSWWDYPSTTEECIQTVWLMYNNAFAWFFVLNHVENDFEHNFFHPFKFRGSPRIS